MESPFGGNLELENHLPDPGEEISATSSRFVLLETHRDKDAARFFEARTISPRRKDLEEEVNRTDAITQMEKESSGLLATIERKQKLRIGAPKGSEEALCLDMELDDVISKEELREAGKDL